VREKISAIIKASELPDAFLKMAASGLSEYHDSRAGKKPGFYFSLK